VAKQAREPASSGPLLQTTTTTTTKKTKVKMSTRVQKIILSGLMAGCVSMAAKAGTGTDHGYFWSLFVSGGSASITFPQAGTYAGNFQINYSNVGDVVGGKGWNPGSSHSIGYNIGSLSGSYNFVGIYGWTTSPLIEYYVCEKGSVASGGVVNSVNSDGHTYNFYRHQQISQPSIQGTQTFWQYLDQWGGTSIGANHTVTMGNHITNWRNNGAHGFGNYNYQILALEAYGTKSGSINATVWGQ
jgi:endo-1,4-beta-xylanase